MSSSPPELYLSNIPIIKSDVSGKKHLFISSEASNEDSVTAHILYQADAACDSGLIRSEGLDKHREDLT